MTSIRKLTQNDLIVEVNSNLNENQFSAVEMFLKLYSIYE